MADTSLDDFFAKKDKSKRKNKAASSLSALIGVGSPVVSSTIVNTTSSTTTTSTSATSGDQKQAATATPTAGGPGTSINEDLSKDERPPTGGGGGSSTGTVGTEKSNSADQPKTNKGKSEEDEWREVEEETKDYSGLKIQNLQISDLRDEEQDRMRSEDNNDDSDKQRVKESHGPWNKTGLATVPVQAPAPIAPVVEAVEVLEEPAEGPKYVPPAMRSGGAATLPPSTAASRLRGRRYMAGHAPELDSEEHFPSLSAAIEVRPAKKGDVSPVDVGFEAVKRGPRAIVEDPNRGPKLNLGNKYDALSRGGGGSS